MIAWPEPLECLMQSLDFSAGLGMVGPRMLVDDAEFACSDSKTVSPRFGPPLYIAPLSVNTEVV